MSQFDELILFFNQVIIQNLILNIAMVELNPNLSGEKPGHHTLLRDVLVENTFKPGRWISPDVDIVDLGVFLDEARGLANSCFLDSDNKDAGKLVYVTGTKKVLIPAQITQGSKDGTFGLIGGISLTPKEIAERNKLDDRYAAMGIITRRNTNVPFFSSGACTLLIPDSHPAALVATFIAGRAKNMLLFRGQNSPLLSVDEADRKLRLWEWQLQERIGQFAKPEMNREEVNNIAERAGRALLRQICQKYDLQFFSGPTDSVFVTKQAP